VIHTAAMESESRPKVSHSDTDDESMFSFLVCF